MSKNDIEIVIGAKDDASAVIDRVSNKVVGFESSFSRFGASMITTNAALELAAKMIFGVVHAAEFMVDRVGTAADRIDELADQAKGLGETVADLDLFQRAMERAGNVSPETAIKGLRTLQNVIGEIALGRNDKAAEIIDMLGLDVGQLIDMGPVDQFRTVMTALAEIDNKAVRASLAFDLMGKSAADIIPAIAEGARGFGEIEKRIDSIRYKISDTEVDGIGRMNDAIDDVGIAFGAVYEQLAGELAPVVSRVAEDIVDWHVAAKPFTEQTLVQTVTTLDMVVDHFEKTVSLAHDLSSIKFNNLWGLAGLSDSMAGYIVTESVGGMLDTIISSAADSILPDEPSVDYEAMLRDADKKEKSKSTPESNPVDQAVEQLRRQAEALELGDDLARKLDLYALATTEEEFQRIDRLLQRIDEAKAVNEQAELEQKLNKPAPTLQATESRLLTRGPQTDPATEAAKETAKNTKRAADAAEKTAENTKESPGDKPKFVMELIK